MCVCSECLDSIAHTTAQHSIAHRCMAIVKKRFCCYSVWSSCVWFSSVLFYLYKFYCSTVAMAVALLCLCDDNGNDDASEYLCSCLLTINILSTHTERDAYMRRVKDALTLNMNGTSGDDVGGITLATVAGILYTNTQNKSAPTKTVKMWRERERQRKKANK